MSFEELGLSAELLRAVAEQGYSIPTPVQRLAIPPHPERPRHHGSRPNGHRKNRGVHPPVICEEFILREASPPSL